MQTNSQWLDLSHPISQNTKPFPGDPVLETSVVTSFEGSRYQLKAIRTGMHLGTHIDFPAHYLQGGKTAEAYPVSRFMGIAARIDVIPVNKVISTKAISEAYRVLGEAPRIIILNTGHGKLWGDESYYSDHPCFEADFAAFLMKTDVEIFFTDLPTVAYCTDADGELHRDLLSRDILIGENLFIPAELGLWFQFVALPLPLTAFEASIVRAAAKNI